VSTNRDDETPLRERIAEKPRPALVWAAVGVVLLGLEFGALLQVAVAFVGLILDLLPGDAGLATARAIETAAGNIPTLLSRELIPNQGYFDGSRYVNTFLGLEPAFAWAIRAVLIYAYAFAVLAWLWNGYNRYRRHYRRADWTPRDDVIDRFRNHSWGLFGLLVTISFVVMAVFAPALGPTTLNENILKPYSNEMTYWDAEDEQVKTLLVGEANLDSGSQGAGEENVAPMTYDQFGRFHPFGTATNGKDLFTQLAFGARISLTIALVSMLVAGAIALALSMVSAYYKGLTDLIVVVTSDSIQALPLIMLLILMVVIFQDTWLAKLYDGAVLIIAIFSIVYWPYLWRSIRGPAFQVSEEDWISAAKSFGQQPATIMKKHMVPYVFSYILIYASLSLGGIIVGVAGLSFLGLGISPPTPEWGRLIADGQQYVASPSWHISLIPGILITILVTGLNAFGDGIRDAVDPKSEGGKTEEAVAGGSGA
jgi:peptide/nickel transport system permease protein